MNCPRCPAPLESDQHLGHTILRCGECRGVLLEQKQLIPMMERIGSILTGKMDLNAPIAAIQGPLETAPCPKCRLPMESHGYMGSNLVHIDRCSECLLIWTDSAEMIAMARMYMQSQGRIESRKNTFENQLDGMLDRAEVRARSILPTEEP